MAKKQDKKPPRKQAPTPYAEQSDKQRAATDTRREKKVDAGIAKANAAGNQAAAIRTRAPGTPAAKKAEKVVERTSQRKEALGKRKQNIDRRQGMNPASGGTGWNWRWDRDPATTKANPKPATGNGANGGGSGGNSAPADDGWSVADSMLAAYGFDASQRANLRNALWGTGSTLRLYVDSQAFGDMLLTQLYSTNEFKERFPSIAEQYRKKLAGEDVYVWSPSEVLDYERTWDAMMPEDVKPMFDKRKTITDLILAGVDPKVEFQERLDQAKWASATAPAEVRKVLADKYGVTGGQLVGFYLDPTKGEEWLKKQSNTAAMRAAGLAAGFDLSWEWSERAGEQLAGSYDNIGEYQSRMRKAAEGAALTGGLGDSVSQETLADAAVVGDAQAQRRVSQVAAQRQGRFNSSGGAAEGRSGVSGLGSSRTT